LSKKIAVIGIGNSLRRDDGIGIVVLESLLKFYPRKGIEYINSGMAGFDLIRWMRDYEVILFIDGINSGLAAGEVRIFELKDIEFNLQSSATSTHELSLKDLLELSRDFGFKAKVYVAGIQVGDTSFGEGLSDALDNKKDEAVGKVVAFIDKILLEAAA
jgi:hydrogenase maturation protease